MPNSERTLRRLRRLGIVVLVLGLFTVAQAVYFQNRTNDATECVAQKTEAIATVLDARAAAASQESWARSREARAVRRVLLSLDSALESEEATPAMQARVVEALADYEATVVEVRAALAEVREQRAANPIPAMPAGRCDLP